MSDVKARVERLEQRSPEPGGPSTVIVDAEGMYWTDGERMTQAEFERRWPQANVTRLHGFDDVVTIGGNVDVSAI